MDKNFADIFLWLIHIPWWQATLILLVAIPLLIIIGTVVLTLIVAAIESWFDNL